MNCWRCGPHSAWDFIGAVLRTSSRSKIASAWTQYKSSSRLPTIREPSPRPRSIRPPPGAGPLVSAHRRYLRKRGFPPRTVADEWDVLGTRHLSGVWNWRLVFPIRNAEGHVVAWCGRSIGKGVKPKYRLTEEEKCLEDPHSLLYGIDRAPEDRVVIVEGPIDVWRLGPGAVALLGTAWTATQANRLRSFTHRFVLLDPGAEKEAEKLAAWLSLFPGETEILEGAETDPGDMDPSKARDLMGLLGFENFGRRSER